MGIPRSVDQIKRGDQTRLHSVSVNSFLGDRVLYCLILSRAITGPSFNFIPYVELNIQEGVHILLLNHLCTKSTTYEGLRRGVNAQK